MRTPSRLRNRRTALFTAVSLLLALSPVGGPPVTPAGADSLPPDAIIVRGRGFGHGRGLSQYGALGWATKFSKTWQEILAFYYDKGHVISSIVESDAKLLPGGNMTVRLQTLDGANTSVISDNATLSWAGQPGQWAALVAKPVGRNTYDVFASTSATCASVSIPATFTRLATAVAGPVEFTSLNGTNPAAVAPTDLVGLCEPPDSTYRNGRIRYYRGSIRAANDGNGNRRTVNVVPLESYLRGVVPRESPAWWGGEAGGLGMNALRAQAVAARSYSVSESRYSYAKTCDTMDCQVYGGAATRTVGGSTPAILEDSRTNAAIAETAGAVIRSAGGAIARTEFTSSNGGRTAAGTFAAKADDGDLAADAQLQTWSRTLSAVDIQKKYPSIGVLTSVVTSHDGLGGEWNGYAVSVTVTGTAGTVMRKAWDFRSDWDLNSPWYDTSPAPAVDPNAAAVGSILYVGDSVSESIANEFAAVVTPAYPNVTWHACAGRGFVGATCIANVAAPQIDTDGIGIVNSVEAPAIAVVALGYNDDQNTVESEVQQMLSALTAKGVQRIIFVNLSTRSTTRSYARTNAALAAAAAANPAVTVLDWNAASGAANPWRLFDNASLCCWVHLNASGQTEFALFLRAQLDDLRARGLLPAAAAAIPVVPGLPLATKNEGAMVRTVQATLNKVLKLTGKKKLATDGQFGKGTAAAVSAFQATANLPSTGTVDRATWDALGLSARPELGVLRKGTKHPSVKTVERALAKVLKTRITADGVYDTALVNHVKTFQKRAGLPQSGRVGPSTWSVLMATAARA
jgi:SpoIID/LytB domain protein